MRMLEFHHTGSTGVSALSPLRAIVLLGALVACGDDGGAPAADGGAAGAAAGGAAPAAVDGGGSAARVDAAGSAVAPDTGVADAAPVDTGTAAAVDSGDDASTVDAGAAGDAGCMAPDAGEYALEDLGTRCGPCNSCPNGLTAVILCNPICGVAGATETCWCEFPCSTRTCPPGTACEVMIGSARGAVCRIE